MAYEPKLNEQKATEAASLLLSMQKGGRADYLWLIKMLFFIDRAAFSKWERPITYDLYVSMPHGPVASTIYNLIMKNLPSNIWKMYIVTLPKNYEVMLNGSPARIKKLSMAEVTLIREIYQEIGHHTGFELEAISHHLPEWHDPNGSSIPINLDELLSVLEYDQEDIKRIQIELEEEAQLDALPGV
jgi:uncharacterized phage-associated protein